MGRLSVEVVECMSSIDCAVGRKRSDGVECVGKCDCRGNDCSEKVMQCSGG